MSVCRRHWKSVVTSWSIPAAIRISATISARRSRRSRKRNCEIITGVVIPPDFTTFWYQSLQQGFKPKVASIGKAILFPVAVEALGKNGNNLSAEVWWSPNHPFESSLTGQSAKDIATAYEKSSGKQRTQPIGFVHAPFELAVDVARRSGDVGDNKGIVNAIAATKLDTSSAMSPGTERTCRPLRKRISPRRLWPAVNGGYATAASATSSSPTTRPRRKFPSAARWSRSRRRI
jgi:hypothetical protein